MKTFGAASVAITLVPCISSVRGLVFDSNDVHVSRDNVQYADIPSGAAKEALDAMNNRWYNTTDGRWNTEAPWWLTGVTLQSVLDYITVTGDRDYLEMAENTIELQSGELEWWPEGGGLFRADSTDDTAWWALDLLSLYDLTGTDEYLRIAKIDEEYLWQYWNISTCDGGLIWNIPREEYTNAIGNEQYILLLAALHNRVEGDELYLDRAVMALEWFEGVGLINEENLINDGLTDNTGDECVNNGQETWTYNQGVILGAYAELYRATNDGVYLEKGQVIADAVLASEELSPNGILREPCREEGCDQDQVSFKGIFMRYLADLDGELAEHPYRTYLLENAESMFANARSTNGTALYSDNWEGPFEEATIGSQSSALSMLVHTVNFS